MSKKFLSMVLALSLAAPYCASAQYVWIDEKGNKQFSDRPPPASVPPSKILKGGNKTLSKSEATPTPEPGTSAKPKSLAERNAEFNKRQKEAEDKAKEAETQQQADSAKASNCSKAKSAKAALESGQRISQFDKSGEKTFMDDKQKAKALDEAKRTLEDCN